MGYKIDDSYLNREVTQDGVAPLTNPQSYEEAILNNALYSSNIKETDDSVLISLKKGDSND